MHSVADLRGREGSTPPGAQILSISCSFWKIWQNRMLAPPGELAPPPRGNPGSATGISGSNGAIGTRPPDQFLSFSCCFLQKSSQIMDFCPKLRVVAAIWEILDPSLIFIVKKLQILYKNMKYSFLRLRLVTKWICYSCYLICRNVFTAY